MSITSTQRRARRTRAKIKTNTSRPRLSVFRSNRHMSAQIINDAEGKTTISVSSMELDKSAPKKEVAKELGALLAKRAKESKITSVVFDRGPYKYHGRVKEFAEAVREGGLDF